MAETRKPYVKRTKHTKLSVVMAADMVGVIAAAEQSGVPESTVRYWLHQPEFDEIRAKTREDLAEEVKAVAHLAWARVAETMPTMEPRDAMFAAEKASTILQLLQGQATSRSEVRDITGAFDDHEREALAAILRDVTDAVEA